MPVSNLKTKFFQRPLTALLICVSIVAPAALPAATVSFEDLLVPREETQRKLSIEGVTDPLLADRISKISVLLYQGQFVRALDGAQALAEEQPDLAQAWQLIGMAQANMGNASEAIEAWDKATDLFEFNATPLVMKAELLLTEGEREAARNAYMAATEKDARNWFALEGLGNMAIQDGDFDTAIDYLEKTLALAPADALDPHLKLAAAHLAKDAFDDATAVLEAFRAQNPSNPSIQVALGKVAFAKGDTQAGLDAYGAAADLAPSDPRHRLRLADAFKMLGRLDDAEVTLAAASEEFPEDTAISYQLGTLIAAQGRYEDALKVFETVLSRDPTATHFRAAASRAFFRLGDFEKAEAEALAAVEVERPPVNDLIWLAVVQERAGKTGEATETYRNVVDRAPDHWLALNNLAALLTESNPADALSFAERAAALSSNAPAVLDTLGWAQHKSGDDDAAEVTYKKVLSSGEASASVFFRAAQIMIASGNVPSAQDALTRALEIDPDFENAVQARQQLDNLE